MALGEEDGYLEQELRVEPNKTAQTKASGSFGCAGNGPGYENVRYRSVRDVGGLPSPAVANRIRMRKVVKYGVSWRLEDCWMQQPSIRNWGKRPGQQYLKEEFLAPTLHRS